MNPIQVEIVACSADDAVEAARGGASRLEICGALGQGGLTPSVGQWRATRAQVDLPAIVMIRPRSGGFCYTDLEFDTMLRDLDAFLEEGVDGFVTGCLTSDGNPDAKRNAELVRRAQGKVVMCHRCYDVVRDPHAALESLIDSGFTRVLTSGRSNSALEGAPEIRRAVEQAAGRIEVVPGGGVRPENAAEVVRLTGVNVVHLAPFVRREDTSCQANLDLSFAGSLDPAEGLIDLIDAASVAATVRAVNPNS